MTLPQTILDTGQNYWVHNLTDKRLTLPDGRTSLLRFDRIEYDVKPGERTIVPWAVIALYFGDPRSQHGQIVEATDSRGKHLVPSRGDELLRLSVFYGVYEQGVETIAAVVPKVKITTLDGVEIVPPCFDPDGDHVYGYQRNMQRSHDVATLLEQLESQHAAMQEEIDNLKAAQAIREMHGDNDGALPVDNPSGGVPPP